MSKVDSIESWMGCSSWRNSSMSSAWIPPNAFLTSKGWMNKHDFIGIDFSLNIVLLLVSINCKVSIRISYIFVIFRSFQTVFSARSMSSRKESATKMLFCWNSLGNMNSGALKIDSGLIWFCKARFEANEPNQWSAFFLGIPHGSRAARKLFQMASVAPTSTGYAHASQKLLKGAASRLIIFWFAPLVFQKAQEDASNHNTWFGWIDLNSLNSLKTLDLSKFTIVF